MSLASGAFAADVEAACCRNADIAVRIITVATPLLHLLHLLLFDHATFNQCIPIRPPHVFTRCGEDAKGEVQRYAPLHEVKKRPAHVALATVYIQPSRLVQVLPHISHGQVSLT